MHTLGVIFAVLLLALPNKSYSLGRDGHAVVGQIAIKTIDSETRNWLNKILGSTDHKDIRFACNWPDIVRDLPQYDYSRPYHYENLPRHASSYQRERDCSDGNCVTERIKYFAARLGQDQLSQIERSKAFNWLCHLTGDLHQPLHAGFADDRGGNTVIVRFEQKQLRLHQIWDTTLIRKHHPDWKNLANSLTGTQAVNNQWDLSEVDDWTNTSHNIVVNEVYPGQVSISRQYEKKSLELIERQLQLAGLRLARILQAIRANQVSFP